MTDMLVTKLIKPNHKILEKIEMIAKEKQDAIDKEYFIKYNYLNKIALSVVKKYKKDVLLYGGTAINEILPKKLQFYGEDEMSDIDIFCTQTTYKSLSAELIAKFKKMGHSLTTINEALHEDTYKLIVDGLQLTDISVVDADMFNTLAKDRVITSTGLYSVNIDYLKYSIHLLLAKPYDSHRWVKVYPRMISLYTAHPVNIECYIDANKFYLESIPKSILNKVATFIRKNKFIKFGWDVIDAYIKEGRKPFKLHKEGLSPVQYISTTGNSDNVANELIEYMENEDVVVIKKYNSRDTDNFIPNYSVITYKNNKWIYIFETESCFSFVSYKKENILSIHSIIYHLYAFYLSTKDPQLLCIVGVLTNILLNNLNSKKPIFNQFSINCYGNTKGLVTLRKEKFERLLQK